MRFLLPFLVALSASVFAVDVDQSQYLPVKPGNEWTMDVVINSANGKVDKATLRRKVEESVEKDGKKYVRFRTSMDGPSPMQYTKLVRKDELGLHTIMENVPNAKEQIEIPLPLKVGNTWKTELAGTSFTSVVAGFEKVTSGDKTYENCFRIVTQSDDGKYREDYWESPKVGNVKSEITPGDGSKMVVTLRTFKAGK